jgi:ammonia channel protein AmtB
MSVSSKECYRVVEVVGIGGTVGNLVEGFVYAEQLGDHSAQHAYLQSVLQTGHGGVNYLVRVVLAASDHFSMSNSLTNRRKKEQK